MELLLNVAWLVVACVALGRWAHARLQGDVAADRRAWCLELAALGCAAVLLFPIVSMSDDLQAEPAAAEAGRCAQATIKSASDHASVFLARAHVAISTDGTRWSEPCGQFLYSLDDRAPLSRLPHRAWCSALRAPPLARF